MKKILLYTLFFLNFNYFCFAQDEERVRKAEAIQIAYLTKELGLTPEEAQKFWPVFNNYREEIKRANIEGRTNANVIERDEKILNIRKKYRGEFKKVIPDEKRVNKIFNAEKNFRDMLQKELQNRQKADDPLKQKGKKIL